MIRSFLSLCAILPLRALYIIGGWWGSLLFRIPNRARATTLRNLNTCFPQLQASEVSALAKESLKNTARTALEMGKAWLPSIEATLSLVKESEGMESFHQAVESKQGVILLAPHLSNWEIFGYYVCDGVPSNFMYQPPKIPALDALLRRARSKSDIKMAPTNRKGVAQLLQALQQGELVGILPDQVPLDAGGEFVDFYGEPALTMTLVSKLIQRTGARVFCGFAERLPAGAGFKVIVKEADPLIYSDKLAESVLGLNRSVEQCVNMALAQYQWEYKRFRRRPDNQEFY